MTEPLQLLLRNSLGEMNLPLTKQVEDQIFIYLQLLSKWNQAYNLTSVRDPKEMVIRHILDSLSIAAYLQGDFILDVGSGAGFPGIPLALFYPKKEFVLLDSNGKKSRFLIQAVQTLKLPNVRVEQERVEAFTSQKHFTTIVTRAFSTLAKFVVLSQHLCASDGCYLAMKGEYPEAELAELSADFSPIVYDLQIPGLDAKRHLVKINYKK